MKNFITYLIFFSLLLFSCSEKENSSTPNIVIIFMDDMGYGDISNFGAINYKTPNLDKLVNNGMLFTNFYSAQAVCSASRAGLLTGTYPNRIGISGALMPYSNIGIHTNEKTIAEKSKSVQNVKKNIENKTVNKQIYIKNKLINFII